MKSRNAYGLSASLNQLSKNVASIMTVYLAYFMICDFYKFIMNSYNEAQKVKKCEKNHNRVDYFHRQEKAHADAYLVKALTTVNCRPYLMVLVGSLFQKVAIVLIVTRKLTITVSVTVNPICTHDHVPNPH